VHPRTTIATGRRAEIAPVANPGQKFSEPSVYCDGQ
jgi:hypothetical protein